MKSFLKLSSLLLLLCTLLLSCRKEELGWKLKKVRAIVATNLATDPDKNSFIVSGTADDDKGAPITERGFCWHTNENVSIENNKLALGSGNGSFSGTITGLLPGGRYYYRAYAINKHGVWYGDERFQITFGSVWPTVLTVSTVLEDTNSVRVTGNLTSDGGYPMTTRGICYAQTNNPDTNNLKVICGSGLGIYDTLISNLPNGEWTFRAFAINDKWVSYGENKKVNITGSSVTTGIPELTTRQATNVGSFSFSTGGDIISDGGSPVTELGICYSLSPNPTLNDMVKTKLTTFYSFSEIIIGLDENTTYYYRAYAKNINGTGYGNEYSVTTLDW